MPGDPVTDLNLGNGATIKFQTIKSREDFFAMDIGKVVGTRVTVRGLIDYWCYVRNGIHPGTPQTDVDRALLQYDTSVELTHGVTSIKFFRNIAPMVLDALRPVTERLNLAIPPLPPDP